LPATLFAFELMRAGRQAWSLACPLILALNAACLKECQAAATLSKEPTPGVGPVQRIAVAAFGAGEYKRRNVTGRFNRVSAYVQNHAARRVRGSGVQKASETIWRRSAAVCSPNRKPNAATANRGMRRVEVRESHRW